jgi:hypothetical protein
VDDVHHLTARGRTGRTLSRERYVPSPPCDDVGTELSPYCGRPRRRSLGVASSLAP